MDSDSFIRESGWEVVQGGWGKLPDGVTLASGRFPNAFGNRCKGCGSPLGIAYEMDIPDGARVVIERSATTLCACGQMNEGVAMRLVDMGR